MDDGADLGQMNGGRLANWAVRFRLQQCIDERAALERGLVKPAVENVEDGQQPRFWIRRAAFNLGLEPDACPDTLAGSDLAPNLAPGGQYFAIFADGHNRQLPKLTATISTPVNW